MERIILQGISLLLIFILFSILGVKLTAKDKDLLVAELGKLKLSHGDFATLLRRYSVLKSVPDASTIIQDLQLETGFRGKDPLHTIGFIANV